MLSLHYYKYEKKLTRIFYELKYAQSHFFDNETGFDNTSGNGILNRIVFNTKNNILFDLGLFYAKNYVSAYSDNIYNSFESDNAELSVVSFGTQYSIRIGSYMGILLVKWDFMHGFIKIFLMTDFPTRQE